MKLGTGEIDGKQILQLVQSTKFELQRKMVTQEQAMTMQEDINGVLLKMKELRDSEGQH